MSIGELTLAAQVPPASMATGVTVETHLDVGDRDEFDVGGSEFGLAGSPLDRDGGGLDRTHDVIGQHDACELAVHAVELAPRRVELGEAGLEPVGLVAVGQLLDRAAGGVDAGLRRSPPRRAPLSPRPRPPPAPRRRW